MALDTANKRFALLGLCDSLDASLPLPDGMLDAGDRLQYLALYRGFADGTGGASMATIYLHHHTLYHRRRPRP